MKKLKILLSVVVLFISATMFSQNSENKWYVGIGMHAVDYTSVRGPFNGFFKHKDYSIVPPLSKITVARSLVKGFAIDLQASVGEIDNKRLDIKDEFFALAGIGFRYSPISKGSFFDPYLRVGANYHNYSYKGVEWNAYDEKTGEGGKDSYDNEKTETYKLKKEFKGTNDMIVVNGGVGVNLWFTKNIGLNVESQYNHVLNYKKTNYADFFQHSAGIVFRFGNNDRDKDGVPDSEDRCPDVAGPKELLGCPDTDGDGVPDIDDKCPDVAGPAENDGCPWPDRDGDGVPDKDDKCPDVAGPAENDGCPLIQDRDGDGVPDDEDRCPDVAGPKELQGCPDTDGDGVPDIDDKCPDVAGPKSNDGCPVTEETVNTEFKKSVTFEFNSSKLTEDSKELIKKVAEKLKDSDLLSKGAFIDGHTDSVGSNPINNKLSKARAASVVEALVEAGIDREKLTPRGFGKQQLKCVSPKKEGITKKECDAINRRVEIKTKQ